MSKTVRKKYPDLFAQDEKPKGKSMKSVKKSTKKISSKEIFSSDNKKEQEAVMKEMVHVLLSKKRRNYTNHDIAAMTGLSVRQVGCMAAWHTGKLAAKRK